MLQRKNSLLLHTNNGKELDISVEKDAITDANINKIDLMI